MLPASACNSDLGWKVDSVKRSDKICVRKTFNYSSCPVVKSPRSLQATFQGGSEPASVFWCSYVEGSCSTDHFHRTPFLIKLKLKLGIIIII